MENALPRTTWRLIQSEPLPGTRNMALDAAIQDAVERSASPPTLRLYQWDPPCISLGYSQPFNDVDLTRLDNKGWDIVRRPTGGRAILHTDELTYSVIGPKTDPRLIGGLMDSYKQISQALFSALVKLGLPVEIHKGKNPEAHQQPVCFENPSDFEITVNGKKIIGSAQARKKNSLLQHGSLPLIGDLTRITEALAYPEESDRKAAAEVLLEKAVTVKDVLGRKIEWQEAAQAFVDGFSQTLNLDLVEGEPSQEELAVADKLESEQYADRDWTRGPIHQRAA